MNIRKAVSQDVDALVDFNTRLSLEQSNRALDPVKVRLGVSHLLENPDEGVYYICEINNQPVGFLMAFFEWSDWRAGNLYYVESAYTLPDFRNQEVFKSLFRQAYEDAKAENTAVRVLIPESSPISSECFTKLGLSESHYSILEVLFTHS